MTFKYADVIPFADTMAQLRQVAPPLRLAAFEDTLALIAGQGKVWLTTGREIAQYFDTHYRDASVAAGHAIAQAP